VRAGKLGLETVPEAGDRGHSCGRRCGRRYRAEFEEAFKAKLAELPLRERNILRLLYVDDLTLDAVARRHRVSSRTVSRWLADVRKALLSHTRRRLAQRVPAENVDEVLDLVRSQLELSLTRILSTRR
jgi:RNA polymerase sigma-70 factor (ECF subfamily)